jgi:hypothetical protein
MQLKEFESTGRTVNAEASRKKDFFSLVPD